LGVGDSFEIVYSLPGPLPAGDYLVAVRDAQQAPGAKLHFDLLWRPTGAADQMIASVDGSLSQTQDGGVPQGQIGAEFQAVAVPAECDDLLVLRITLVSGSPFLEILSSISIP
jgi:hypothetical protein